MATPSGAYVIMRNRISTTTAITVLQMTNTTNHVSEIIRATGNQSSSTTSTSTALALLRKSVAATGTSAVTPVAMSEGHQSSGVTAGRDATGEGTDGNITFEEGFNIVGNGMLYLPVPEERELIGPSDVFAMKFTVAPTGNWTNQIRYLEYRV